MVGRGMLCLQTEVGIEGTHRVVEGEGRQRRKHGEEGKGNGSKPACLWEGTEWWGKGQRRRQHRQVAGVVGSV